MSEGEAKANPFPEFFLDAASQRLQLPQRVVQTFAGELHGVEVVDRLGHRLQFRLRIALTR